MASDTFPLPKSCHAKLTIYLSNYLLFNPNSINNNLSLKIDPDCVLSIVYPNTNPNSYYYPVSVTIAHCRRTNFR